jgi:hypothetical protein
MPGLGPGIHDLSQPKDVDGRDKPGHDVVFMGEWLSGFGRDDDET